MESPQLKVKNPGSQPRRHCTNQLLIAISLGSPHPVNPKHDLTRCRLTEIHVKV